MELLSPAGNLTKLKIALLYGADAVYFGGKDASLRSNAEFSIEDLASALEYVHSFNSANVIPAKAGTPRACGTPETNPKAYITANIFPHNRDLGFLKEYIQEAARANPDGLIISDLGVFDLCQKYAPNVPIHISTQANNTNYQSALKWHEMGAKRIILARELTLDEIKEYRENTPESLELEVFVHGAMCMGYSGRCLISSYLTGRDANCGSCAQPCRWEYSSQSSVVSNQGENNDLSLILTNGNHIIEVQENSPHKQLTTDYRLPTTSGTFFLNSNDLCLIEHLAELEKIGINSIKIEGRNKSEYYVAATTKAYRTALDNPDKPFDNTLLSELEKVSHRPYVYNFGELTQNYGSSNYIRSSEVMGIVAEQEAFDNTTSSRASAERATRDPQSVRDTVEKNLIPCFQRGKILAGDSLEILTPSGPNISIENAEIFDPLTFEPIESTPHAEMPFYLKSPLPAPPNSFIRKKTI